MYILYTYNTYIIYPLYIGSAIHVFWTAGKDEERSTEDLKTGVLQSGHVCIPQE